MKPLTGLDPIKCLLIGMELRKPRYYSPWSLKDLRLLATEKYLSGIIMLYLYSRVLLCVGI
jgi:hypothetical protein